MQVNTVASPFAARYLPTGRNVMGFRGRLAGIEDYIPSIDSLGSVLDQYSKYRLEQARIAAELEKARIEAQAKKPAPVPFPISDALDSGMGITTNTILLGVAALGGLYLLTRRSRR